MKKLILILPFLLTLGCVSDNPTFKRLSARLPFAFQLGDETKPRADSDFSADDFCNSITVDRFENIYCAGGTRASMGELQTGGKDSFVIKMDKKGKIIWITQLGTVTKVGSNLGDDECLSVIVDHYGNVYCGGKTNGLAPLGTSSFGAFDGFTLKLNSQGKLMWLHQFGTTGSDSCDDLALAPDGGSVYCAGSTNRSFAPGGLNPSLVRDSYVIKIGSQSGSESWVKQLSSYDPGIVGFLTGPGASDSTENSRGLVIDRNGLITMVGNTFGSLTEAGSPPDIFLWQLDSSGVTKKVKQYGSSYPWSLSTDTSRAITVDTSGDFYIGGETQGGFLDIAGQIDILMMKINASTLEPIWLRQIGQNAALPGNNAFSEFCFDIQVDAQKNAYCFGYTLSTLADTLAGGEDIVVVKLDPSGAVQKILQFGGNAQASSGKDFTGTDHALSGWLDADGNVYVGGETQSSIGETHSLGLNLDLFLFRLSPNLEASDLNN